MAIMIWAIGDEVGVIDDYPTREEWLSRVPFDKIDNEPSDQARRDLESEALRSTYLPPATVRPLHGCAPPQGPYEYESGIIGAIPPPDGEAVAECVIEAHGDHGDFLPWIVRERAWILRRTSGFATVWWRGERWPYWPNERTVIGAARRLDPLGLRRRGEWVGAKIILP